MIGILGGTFDPVHFGHLRPALELFEQLRLSELRLLPCHIPAHRQQPEASAEQRAQMLQRAIAGEPCMQVDRRELRRSGPSYSVDTLHSLREELGEQQPLCFIMGMDAFMGLRSWHQWERLIALAHIVVAHRPGSAVMQISDLGESMAAAQVDSVEVLHARPAGGVLFQATTQLDISSTAVREIVRAGRNPRYLLPESVCAYIRENGLYT